MTTTTIYDSAQPRLPLLSEFRHFWTYRGLIGLLVNRDLTVRYKRSLLGVWWTLLNPLLTAGIMYLIFGQLFGRASVPPTSPTSCTCCPASCS